MATPPPLPKDVPQPHSTAEHAKPVLTPSLVPKPSQRALRMAPWAVLVTLIWAPVLYFGRGRAPSHQDVEVRPVRVNEPPTVKEKPQHEDPAWVDGVISGFTEHLGTRQAAIAEYESAKSIAAGTNLTIENAVFGLLALSKSIHDESTRRFVLGTMADLAEITDRRAFTFRMGILVTEKIYRNDKPPREYFDEFVKLGIRQDFVYSCIADKSRIRRRTQEEKNIRAAQMISSSEVDGKLLTQCICEATMRQAGVNSAGSASARSAGKLQE